ncbi:MAG: hypothetical protein ACFFED_08225 [Candidatus Thorarchaeota archaeon]
MAPPKKSDTFFVGEVLIVFGAIVSFIFGLLYFLNLGVSVSFLPFLNIWGILGAITNLFIGIVLILLSLITLATFGILKIPLLRLQRNVLAFLILGFLTYMSGGTLGGVFIIIGALLMLF